LIGKKTRRKKEQPSKRIKEKRPHQSGKQKWTSFDQEPLKDYLISGAWRLKKRGSLIKWSKNSRTRFKKKKNLKS